MNLHILFFARSGKFQRIENTLIWTMYTMLQSYTVSNVGDSKSTSIPDLQLTYIFKNHCVPIMQDF